jgi:hypothetical protein
MALSLSEVYHLTGDMLRSKCWEQGLDHSGPVRSLRQRLADHIRSGPMNTLTKPEETQASVSNDMVHNMGITAPPVVARGSHGSGGDGPISRAD